MKRVQTASGAIALICVLALVAFIACDNTEYSAGFSEERFRLVTPGMTASAVESLLGPSLAETIGPFPETWRYTRKPSPGDRLFRFDPLKTREVCFVDGAVAIVFGFEAAEVAPGMTVEEVLSRVGLPEEVMPAYYRKVWYSRQSGTVGRVSVRAVLFSLDSKVVDTQAYWDFD